MLVLDEADALLSFGYDDELAKVKAHLPTICQTFLLSATLGRDVLNLKSLMLHSPAVIELEEEEVVEGTLTQYYITAGEIDKFLIFYVLLKLKLITGKILVFVRSALFPALD